MVVGGGAAGLMAAITAARSRAGCRRHRHRRGAAPWRQDSHQRRRPLQRHESRRDRPGLQRWSAAVDRAGAAGPASGRDRAVLRRARRHAPRGGARQAVPRLEPRRHGARCAARRGRQGRRAAAASPACRTGSRRPMEDLPSPRTTGALRADRVVLASGGMSVPKTGSDGAGYAMARALGHAHRAHRRPRWHRSSWMGRSTSRCPASATRSRSHSARRAGASRRITGDLLWTHFGASGPARARHFPSLASRRHRGRAVAVDLSFRPGERFEAVDAQLIAEAAARPRASIATVLAARSAGLGGRADSRHAPHSTRRARWRICREKTAAASRTR